MAASRPFIAVFGVARVKDVLSAGSLANGSAPGFPVSGNPGHRTQLPTPYFANSQGNGKRPETDQGNRHHRLLDKVK
jgi:hypothetical protein